MVAANALSLSRVPLAGLLWVAPTSATWVLSMMALAGLSDVLDGWVARRARKQLVAQNDPGAHAAWGHRGEVIDGFADKVFVSSAVLVLWLAVGQPLLVVLFVASRELLFAPLMLFWRLLSEERRERVRFQAQAPGKIATIAQFVALVLGILEHESFLVAAWIAGALGAGATAYYVARALEPLDNADGSR